MMLDLNDLIIEFEANISKNKVNKGLFINESFVLWYILVEGIPCESFTELDIRKILIRNTNIYQSFYSADADCNFIIGWMVSIAFWYFEPLLNERDGLRLLNEAYERDPANSLFKWAIRKELDLGDVELKNLKTDIAIRYYQLYNYSALLKEYFLEIVAVSKI